MKRAYIHTKNVGRVLFNDVYAFLIDLTIQKIHMCDYHHEH